MEDLMASSVSIPALTDEEVSDYLARGRADTLPPPYDGKGYTLRAASAVLPTNSQERKDTPIYSGVLRYFPRALAYIAKVSKTGNDKHNPGQPLHWSKGKSNDHGDCVARHLLEAGTIDPDDNLRHSGKLAWRALALLEIELENGEKSA